MADRTFDCRSCGACCRQASDGRILVPASDIVRWRRQGRQDLADGLIPGHFSELAFASKKDGSCIHLGVPGHPNDCAIYVDRASTCSDFEPGSWQCLEFRREAGIER